MTTLYQYLRKAEALPPFSDEEDGKELRAILSNKTLMKALSRLDKERLEVLSTAQGWNLATPGGLSDAIRAQGRAIGLERALDALWDMAGGEDLEISNG